MPVSPVGVFEAPTGRPAVVPATVTFAAKRQFDCTAAVERNQLKRSKERAFHPPPRLRRSSRGGGGGSSGAEAPPPDFQVTWFHGRRWDQHDLVAMDARKRQEDEQRLAPAPATSTPPLTARSEGGERASPDFRVTWFHGRKFDAYDMQAADAREERELSDGILRQKTEHGPKMVPMPPDRTLGRARWVSYSRGNHRTATDDDALDAKLNHELAERVEVTEREKALRAGGMSAAKARALAQEKPARPRHQHMQQNQPRPSSLHRHSRQPQDLWVSHFRRADSGDTLRRQAAKDIAAQYRPPSHVSLSSRGQARLKTKTEWQQPKAVLIDPSVSIEISETINVPLNNNSASPALR